MHRSLCISIHFSYVASGIVYLICLTPGANMCCSCSAAVAAGGGEREAGAPAPGAESRGADGAAAGKG